MSGLFKERIKICDLINLSFEEFFKNIKDIAMITLIFGMPTAIANFLEEKDIVHDSIFKGYSGDCVSLLTMLFVTIGSMAVIKLISESIKGNKIGWQKAIRDTLPKSGSAIIATILSIIIILLFTMLLIVPGIIAGVALSLCLQFIVLEDSKAWDALEKSKNLLNGQKGDTFFKYLILVVFIVGMNLLITAGMDFLVVSFSPIIIIGSLISSFIEQLIVIAITIIYINLKNMNESYDLVA